MKCLYEGCVKQAVTDGFCDTCYPLILKARERLKKNGGKVEGRTPVFNHNLGVEKHYDSIDEINLNRNRRGNKARKKWYNPSRRFDYAEED